MIKIVVTLCTFIVIVASGNITWTPLDTLPLTCAYPCKNTKEVVVWLEPGLSPKDSSRYYVYINETFPADSVTKFSFDSEVKVILTVRSEEKKFSRISLNSGESFTLRLFKQLTGLSFIVKGSTPGLTPYLTALSINGVNYCDASDVGYLYQYAADIGSMSGEYQWIAESQKSKNVDCGRPKVVHAEPLVNGPTKPGDWPWHAAIHYRLKALKRKMYITGGTLISKNMVMTVAHHMVGKGKLRSPDVFSVALGKYTLDAEEEQSQDRNVQKIIIHEDFNPKNFSSNIGLLKLDKDVTVTDFVRPACLWHRGAADRLKDKTITGIIVGWGYGNDNTFPDTLQQALLPMVSAEVCIRSYPDFFAYYLHMNSFCAGYHNNGTSACNGDSGGGFHIFVPDEQQDGSRRMSGSWHVRGIVSHHLALLNKKECDPDQYTVFTDVGKQLDWIEVHLHD
ncbi:limulus clotting factor C-like [Pararge aegeria]|uniref:limulus clotting factor C-like n=1 Tax=Pararge aegeria TaxID=116150 RepID=UPI0019D19DC6|nr:limulus clotting factor C-like [Pararge aegeria]